MCAPDRALGALVLQAHKPSDSPSYRSFSSLWFTTKRAGRKHKGHSLKTEMVFLEEFYIQFTLLLRALFLSS